MTNIIQDHYNYLCGQTGDINEHLPTLASYASKCESVAELGVRGCISSWAFCKGLLENGSTKKSLFMNDIQECDVSLLESVASETGIDITHQWINDLNVNFDKLVHTRRVPEAVETTQLSPNTLDSEPTLSAHMPLFDLVFIDTWHIYGQLKRELAKYAPVTNKFIIMHDTEVDGIYGETIRCGWNPHEQSANTGIPVDEIVKGLRPAVNEFLEYNDDWTMDKHYTNNNGLTILRRK